MITPADLVAAFNRNTRIIEAHCDGLSNDDSLIQTEFNINCLNWTIGHIVWYRDEMLEFLGHEGVAPNGLARYAQESEPILGDGPDVLPLSELLALTRKSQDRIAEVLGDMEEAGLEEERTRGEHSETVGSRVHFHYFHDTYHGGQTELLRQVAGVNDKII